MSSFFLSLLHAGIGCSGANNSHYDASPQFDGERFTNPSPIASPGAASVARHIMFGRDGDWPRETIESTHKPLAPKRSIEDSEVVITLVNHATVLIEFAGLTVLTDPVWSERVGPRSWAGPKRACTPGIPFDALPPIDVVLISHNHYDHMDMPTLIKLERRDAPLFLVPLGDKELLEDAGITRVEELDWWQEVALDASPGMRAIFLPAQHNSGRGLGDDNRSLWGSLLIEDEASRSVYFAGDTAYNAHFEEIRARYGAPSVALLPIGAYAPREKMRPFHMDPDDAVRSFQDLGAHAAVGIHHGTFQLTAEDFDEPAKDLATALEARGLEDAPFLVLPEGSARLFALSPARVKTSDHSTE